MSGFSLSEDKRALFIAGGMILASFVFLASLALVPSRSGDDVAAVFPLEMSLTDVTKAVSALPFRFVRTGFLDSIVVLRPVGDVQLELLSEAGALMVVDAYASGGCVFFTRPINDKV